MNVTNNSGRKPCPYMEKCYRKNPIHFDEMEHPHLEKLVINQLDGSIKIPAYLDFECADRSELLEQLKVLQMVLRKRRDSGQDIQPTLNDLPTTLRKENNDLKEKIERHKQITAQRREEKLKELDAVGASIYKASTSNGGESDSLVKKESKEPGRPNNDLIQGKKRIHENSNEQIGGKRNKGLEDKKVSNETESGSSKKNMSWVGELSSGNSMESRDKLREKFLNMIKMKGYSSSVVEPGDFALKFALSAPYHFFLTRVEKSKETYDQQLSVTFPEILDRSLGEIVSSLHINFMVDVGWLCLQYLLAGQCNNMMILHGDRTDTEKLPLNITLVPIAMPTRFGTHHSKIMVLKYKDNGIRIIVSTANLYSDDWENRTQGLWISPHLAQLPEDASPNLGESPTGFKKDFERYLLKYNNRVLTEWVYLVRRADFSSVNVFFVASVPGSHKELEINLWGIRKLSYILTKHADLPPDAPQWTIVAQSSSLGRLGVNYDSWILKDIVPSMSMEINKGLKSHPNFQFIYPTIDSYKNSFDCQNGSCCLPYSMQTHANQRWFESHMCQWKAKRIARDRAMPHIKCYTRLSPDLKKIPWFVLTSANLSKAAWGNISKPSVYIMNYEAGVVFLPKFVTKGTTFPIVEEKNSSTPVFPMPYDLPLTTYKSQDKPFVMEFFNDVE